MLSDATTMTANAVNQVRLCGQIVSNGRTTVHYNGETGEEFSVTRAILRVDRQPRPEVQNPGADEIWLHFYNDYGKDWEPWLTEGTWLSVAGQLRINFKGGRSWTHVKVTEAHMMDEIAG
jgi:hypothetical protein